MNKEKERQQKRETWNKHKDKYNEKLRKKYRENKEYRKKKKLKDKEWILKHPAKIAERLEQKRLKSKRTRFEILDRDNFTCQYCGRKPPEVILEIDHIYPKSKNGRDSKENYKTSCRDCNVGKGDYILKLFNN